MKKAIKQLHIYRRIVSVVLFCILCLNMAIPVLAGEASGSCGTFLEWTLSGDVLTISGSGDMADYSDSKLAPWYPYAEDIKTISLPSGLLSIGEFAFYGCSNLTSVRIPEKVVDIGEYAFAQCTGILQIHLGNTEKLGEGAFQGCESLTAIDFPQSLQEIGPKAFYRCYNLSAVTIPDTVKIIGSSAFTYCTGLVRAVVNAPISVLPGWMFYGCSNLTDVSLAPTITSVGEYAFESCESLNGIYTQTGSADTAYEIEQSLSKGEGTQIDGFVASFDMPESSIVTTDDGNEMIQTTVVQTEDTVVTTKVITDHSEEVSKDEIIIQATVVNENDWMQLEKITTEVVNKEKSKDITVEIDLMDAVVDSEMLELFAGKNVILKIALENGIIWKVYMSDLTEKNFSGEYDFSTTVSLEDSEQTEIVGEKVYRLKFADRIDFNTSIGFKEGSTYDLISLYQKEEGSYQIINTVVVDQDGWAWFNLGRIDKNTEYCIGLNVEGVQRNDAVIPDTMLQYYDIDEQDEESYLMDEDGVKYQITGRSSKWGISGKQFAIYVGVAIFATVLVVGIIMTTINIIRRSREKYERMAEEYDAKEQSEDELRMEIMRELLDKEKNKE